MLKVAPKNCEAKLFERWWTVKWLGGANIKINLFDGRQWLSRLHFGHSFGAWRCTRGTVGLLHLLDWARMNTFAAVQQICWNNWLWTGHFCALLWPWFQWVECLHFEVFGPGICELSGSLFSCAWESRRLLPWPSASDLTCWHPIVDARITGMQCHLCVLPGRKDALKKNQMDAYPSTACKLTQDFLVQTIVFYGQRGATRTDFFKGEQQQQNLFA